MIQSVIIETHHKIITPNLGKERMGFSEINIFSTESMDHPITAKDRSGYKHSLHHSFYLQ
jgi:hypothetical protein